MRIFFSLLLVLFLFSCEKESDSYIIVTPSDLIISAENGDILRFNISGYSDKGIQSIGASLSPKNKLSTVVLDSVLNDDSKRVEFIWEYQVPSFPDTLVEAELNFSLTTLSGESVWNTKKIYISTNDYLEETEGFEMNSSMSSNSLDHNGFSFFSLSTVQSDFTDSTELHFMDATDSSYTVGDLSRKWISPAGAKFVRFNSFDYAKTNLGNVINSFNSGVPSNYVNNIESKDIILVRYKKAEVYKYAVIKITSVIDEQGVDNDRYIFNVKK